MAKSDYTNEQVARVLERARHKIATRDRWTQRAERRLATRADGTRYVTHCSIGAINAVRCDYDLKSEAITILASVIEGRPIQASFAPSVIISFNDRIHRRHEDILRIFAIAIANTKQEEEPLSMDIKEIPPAIVPPPVPMSIAEVERPADFAIH